MSNRHAGERPEGARLGTRDARAGPSDDQESILPDWPARVSVAPFHLRHDFAMSHVHSAWRTSSRTEYERRIHRVLAHIDRHLDQPLDLPTLADVAHFSRHHFHRVFAAWMGETLGDYLRRRRVEVAAIKLGAQPRLTVFQAALAVGFGSGEAFARAFRLRFGVSPTAWRRQCVVQRRGLAELSNPGQVPGPGLRQHPGFRSGGSMRVRQVDKASTSVAYLRHVGAYGDAVGDFWRQTVFPWLHAQNLTGRSCFGIAHDDPSLTDTHHLRYDAAVELPTGTRPAVPALTMQLPGGRYAVQAFHGRSDEIGAAWDALLRDWLPDSGLQLDNRPCFEHYPGGAQVDADSGRFACELCIAVAPL
jgi:AraC family transcriptional regulator